MSIPEMPFRGGRLVLAVFALIGFVGVSVSPAHAAPSPHAKKYVATQKIHRDARTGRLRVPTPAETAALVATLEQLTNRSAKGLVARKALDGARVVDLDRRFGSVMISKPREDGSQEVRCVSTFEQAADFLGLVPEGEVGSVSDNTR